MADNKDPRIMRCTVSVQLCQMELSISFEQYSDVTHRAATTTGRNILCAENAFTEVDLFDFDLASEDDIDDDPLFEPTSSMEFAS